MAGLEYVGLSGITRSCVDAVLRYLQFGDKIKSALILTCSQEHALLLTLDPEQLIVVKQGFSSGYVGEGPHGFATVLHTLDAFGVEIDECVVSRAVMSRIESSNLTERDMSEITEAPPRRPTRWHDYVYAAKGLGNRLASEPGLFPSVMPWYLIDDRLLDMAHRFRQAPGEAIFGGFKRLEDILRQRTGLDDHGAKLFSKSLLQDDSVLWWKDMDTTEQKARAALFTATFGAFRNPRAHRELAVHNDLAEFLALNQLYLLEGEAEKRPLPSTAVLP